MSASRQYLIPLAGGEREAAIETIRQHHYTHSVSSGKSHYFRFQAAIVCFSIPANKNIARFLGVSRVWELSRLWAPNGHEHNLLSQAISHASRAIAALEHPDCLVSYADPNADHLGGAYRAASWIYLGQCEESRAYKAPDGSITARRKFHSGEQGLTKTQIEAKGFKELKLLGKHRFARPLTREARRALIGVARCCSDTARTSTSSRAVSLAAKCAKALRAAPAKTHSPRAAATPEGSRARRKWPVHEHYPCQPI